MKGACFCGLVAFEINAPSLWCGHCHCSMCQQIHGAGVVTWVGCSDSSITFASEDHLKWYKSSEAAERGSCDECGTQLFFRSSRWPGEIHVTRTSFRGEVDREPQGHAFHENRAAWLQLADTPETGGAD